MDQSRVEFACYLDFVGDKEREVLENECKILFTAKSKPDKNTSYSEGQTFWIGAKDTPSLASEHFAQRVFRTHTQNVAFDADISGAEFWPLVLEGDDDVGPHYDKDYGAEDDAQDKTDPSLYPHVGTVTYLAGSCVASCPTLFLKQLECSSLPCSVERGWLSGVIPKKHVVFDGRWLHCASTQMSKVFNITNMGGGDNWVAPSSSIIRVTLLVNIWLNKRPQDAVPCPFRASASSFVAHDESAVSSRREKAPVVELGSERGTHVKMRLDKKRVLKFCVDVDVVKKAVSPTSTTCVELVWRTKEGCVVVVESKKKEQKKKNKDKKKGKKK